MKTSAISVRIEDDLKSDAEQIFQQLGLTSSQAITLFYKQVILQHGLPFVVRLPLHSTTQVTPATVRSVRGKYAHVPISADEFAQRKQAEIALEG
ncbi:MAG: type II toxin-antitoxin system RelB/DinJ family antitoxin [Caldilineaceae bacterium]